MDKTEQATEAGTCYAVKKFMGARVEVEPSVPSDVARSKPERQEKWYRQWAKEFQEFLRDHRSQDVNGISVVVDSRKVCSACGHDWERYQYEAPDGEALYHGCSYCGLPVQEEGK
jgi:hypothetical protein